MDQIRTRFLYRSIPIDSLCNKCVARATGRTPLFSYVENHKVRFEKPLWLLKTWSTQKQCPDSPVIAILVKPELQTAGFAPQRRSADDCCALAGERDLNFQYPSFWLHQIWRKRKRDRTVSSPVPNLAP